MFDESFGNSATFTKNINVEIQGVKLCRRDQCEWANGIYGHKWAIALLNTFSFCLD